MAELRFDEIGNWSEVKLDIIREYAKAYTTILAAQRRFSFVYIDGFSGAGVHARKGSGDLVAGSPLNALNVDPPFNEHFLIDLNGDKIDHLRTLVGDRRDVHLFQGDCNEVLLREVFPKVRYEDFRRGLCLLDPYGLHLDWAVLEQAGRLRTLDVFLNFPIMDMNRNALWRNPGNVPAEGIGRMTKFWGDESWRSIAYKESPQMDLFGTASDEKVTNDEVAIAFRRRLKEVAGFAYVPEPMAMRNRGGAIVYYLFFASPKEVAGKVFKYIKGVHEKKRR